MKKIILLTIFLLAISFVSAVEPTFDSVTASNFFISQSGQLNMTRTEFQNENCLRYFSVTIPAQFSVWIPPATGVQIGTTSVGGNIQTTAAINQLSYRDATNTEIGQINIVGNIWTYHFNDGDNSACLEASTLTTTDSFNQGIFTNPSTQASYTFSATSQLANDPTVYSSGTPFIIIYDYLTYVSNLYNITNTYYSWNLSCNMQNNQTVLVNITAPNVYNTINNSYLFNISILNNINNSNICTMNATQVNVNNNTCSYTSNVYANSTCSPTTILNVSTIQICNGSTYINLSQYPNFNTTNWFSLWFNSTNLITINNTLNYTCAPHTEIYMNWSGNQSVFDYNYFIQNNMSLTGLPPCTCNCNPPACPTDPAPIINVTITNPIMQQSYSDSGSNNTGLIIALIIIAVIGGLIYAGYAINKNKQNPVQRIGQISMPQRPKQLPKKDPMKETEDSLFDGAENEQG